MLATILSEVAARVDATSIRVALAWPLRRAPNILLMRPVAHLRENLASEIKLPDDVVTAINRIGDPVPLGNQSAQQYEAESGRKEIAVTLITRLDKTVAVTVQTRAAAPPQHAFKVNVPIDLSLVFKGWGPFPAVRGVKNQTGEWDHVGASRNPVLSDGTTANETLIEYTVGHSFAYEVTDFTNILGRLVEGVRGEWTFTPDGAGTVIRWTYEFKPRRGRYFLVRRGLAPLWRHYMQAGIEAAAQACE